MERKVAHVWCNQDEETRELADPEAMVESIMTTKDTKHVYYAAEEHAMMIERPPSFDMPEIFETAEKVKKALADNNNQWHMVSGRLPVFNMGDFWPYLMPEVQFHSWPFYFAYTSLGVIEHEDRKEFISQKPTKAFAIKNNRPHYHRCVLMDAMAKTNPKLIDDNIVTWVIPSDLVGPESYPWHSWEERRIVYGEDIVQGDYAFNLNDPVGYGDALFDIIPESDYNSLFYTEKTMLAILKKKPFFIFGAQYANTQFFSRFGFKSYEEVLHFGTYYDSFQNVHERADSITQSLNALHNMGPYDWEMMRHDANEIADFNFARLCEIILNDEFMPELVKEFDLYANQIEDSKRQIEISDHPDFVKARDDIAAKKEAEQERKLKEQIKKLREQDPFIYR